MIDLPTAKKHLRVDSSDEDALISAYLSSAISAVQNATGKLFSAAPVTQVLDGFPSCSGPIRLWKGPVDGETAGIVVKYDDPNGVEQMLGDFRLVEGSDAQLLPAYGMAWLSTAVGPATVRVSYTAGYADGDVPAALDQAVLLLTAHFYANREAVNSGPAAQAIELPLGVAALTAPYRPTRLA